MIKKLHFQGLLTSLSLMLTLMSCSQDNDTKDIIEPEPDLITAPLEKKVSYDFEMNELDYSLFKPSRYEGGSDAKTFYDEQKGIVMYLNKGYVTMSNPFRDGKTSKAVSLTFWMKQDSGADSEVNGSQDLEGALFSFENDNASTRLYFTANGTLAYEGVDGEWCDNDPSKVKTGYLSPANVWHYVALIITNSGYSLYVDGEEKENKIVKDFDFSKLVSLINGVSKFHIGYGSGIDTAPWKIDDLCFYRNLLTDAEIVRPTLQEGDKSDSMSQFDYVEGAPIGRVGAFDCTTGWWKEFSNYYRIPSDCNIKLSFTNHTNFKGNGNNWVLCLANDKDRDTDGYSEYFILRSNLEGSGSCYASDNISGEGYDDWDKFRADMEGAEVTLDIRRSGGDIYVTATAIAKNGNGYIENFHASCGDADKVMRAFLTVDGSCLEIHTEKCRAYRNVNVDSLIIGNVDNSSGWSQAYSDYFTVAPEANLQLEFTNYTCGNGNWNNWNLYISTDADRGDIKFIDYMLLRSDLYGWGASYNQENWTHSGYGDWDQFRRDMNGAHVVIEVERNADKVTYTSVATSGNGNGNVYTESLWGLCGEGNQNIRCFMCVDGSHFEMIPEGCYCYVSLFK